MKKIGILFGMEESFPNDIVENINRRNPPGIKAAFVKIDAVKMDELLDYNVILDRISHDVPFYNSILKMAILQGVKVINNPFWKKADDNFFNYVLASQMKINIPKTIILPSKEHPSGTTALTLTNLKYPLDWDEIFNYIGFPAFIKPNIENTTHIFFKIFNKNEFFSAYDLTGDKVMLLQESIEYEEFYRCYVIGKKYVNIMNYNPEMPRHQRFSNKPKAINEKLKDTLEDLSKKICTALGFDFNVVEFAIRDGVPYAVEFINTAPTAERIFLYDQHYDWLVEKTSDYLIELAKMRKSKPGSYNWSRFLSGKTPKK
jgi:glutathione synthase/RimK-type ligase-like ATP-grasp enzyme